MRKSYIAAAVAMGVAAIWFFTHSPEAVAVKVHKVDRGVVEATVSNTRAGTIKACRRAKLSLSIGGQITKLPYPEGSMVKRGDLLLAIDNTDLMAEIEHLKAQTVSAQSKAKAVCLRAEQTKRSADRTRRLDTPGTISKESYDKVITEAEIAAEECAAAKNAITVAQTSLKVGQERLGRTYLYAPFDGIIAKINGELNEYVTPSPPGIPMPPAIDLIEPGCFVVTVPIDELDVSKVALGMPARITLDAWRNRQFQASVSRIGSYVIDQEKQARTVDVELKFSDRNISTLLLVGYSADATIITATHQDAVRIPTQALLDDDHVLLFDPADKRLKKHTVTKGLSNWSYTEVTQGLKTEELVVLSLGDEGVIDGAYAQISKESPQ